MQLKAQPPRPNQTGPLTATYNQGFWHGQTPGHPFRPPIRFSRDLQAAYTRGFDDGVDHLNP